MYLLFKIPSINRVTYQLGSGSWLIIKLLYSRLANFILESPSRGAPSSTKAELTSIGLPDTYVQKFSGILASLSRPSTFSASLPRFSSCEWSLDVAISSSRILKLLEPTVTLEISSDKASQEPFRFQVKLIGTWFHQAVRFGDNITRYPDIFSTRAVVEPILCN